MFRVVISSILLSAALVAGAFVPISYDVKIVEGRNTSIEEVPYQVAIETDDGDQFCGGSIITKKHVLTAGHCFIDADLTKISIRTGSSERGIGGTVIKASKVNVHPQYNRSGYDYDVVVIELESEIELSEVSQIIGLVDSEPEEGTEALIAGWGRLELAGGPSDLLQSVTISIANHEKCVESFEDDDENVTDMMICAGGGETGPCKGDSGGGLVVATESGEGAVAGILSFGGRHGCAWPGYYIVFTDVAHPDIRSFIREQTAIKV